MIFLADLPFDTNIIVVLVAVIFAAIKAFIEKKNGTGQEEEINEEELYREYEAELRRQQEAMGQQMPSVSREPEPEPEPVPQPVVQTAAPVVSNPRPIRPTLSAAEKQALENFKKLSSGSSRKRKVGPTRSRVIRHLSSPTAAREALVLSEVLGPPKGLRNED